MNGTAQCGRGWDIRISYPDRKNRGPPPGAHTVEGNEARWRLTKASWVFGALGIPTMYGMGVERARDA